MKTTSITYTVGRSEGVVYPPAVGPAPTAIQLAELYDKAAKRIAQLEATLRDWIACAERLALLATDGTVLLGQERAILAEYHRLKNDLQ
jgi:hypothetical protein